MFTKGDIILPKEKGCRKEWLEVLYHPAIIWQDTYNGVFDFNGIMLTISASSAKFDNIAMAEEDFELTYKNSHFVNQLLVKFGEWGEFEKIGELKEEGIAFVEANLSNKNPFSFEEYMAFLKD